MTSDLKVGDVVQVDMPGTCWHGCFMLVTEPKTWGAQGCILIPEKKDEPPVQAFLRCKHEEMEFIGPAVLVPANHVEEVEKERQS